MAVAKLITYITSTRKYILQSQKLACELLTLAKTAQQLSIIFAGTWTTVTVVRALISILDALPCFATVLIVEICNIATFHTVSARIIISNFAISHTYIPVIEILGIAVSITCVAASIEGVIAIGSARAVVFV